MVPVTRKLPLTSRVYCGFEVLIPVLLDVSMTYNWLLRLTFLATYKLPFTETSLFRRVVPWTMNEFDISNL